MNTRTKLLCRLAMIGCLCASAAAMRAVTGTAASQGDGDAPKVAKHVTPNRPVRKLPHRPTYSNEQIINGIESNDMQVRMQTMTDWTGNRDQLVRELMQIAKSNRDEHEYRSPQELAIIMLGELRCHEAIPLLLENIDEFYARGILNELDPYPCAIALRRIGPSCVRQMLARIRSAPIDQVSDKAIELYAVLLHEFYGLDSAGPQEAVAVVDRYLARPDVRNAGPKNSANLRRLAHKVREQAGIKDGE